MKHNLSTIKWREKRKKKIPNSACIPKNFVNISIEKPQANPTKSKTEI